MFSRLGKLIKGFFSMFISNLETANPKALLEAEIASFQEAVGTYNKSLAQQAALVEKMRNQIAKQKTEFEKLKGKIAILVKSGQQEEAGRLALQAKNLSQSLAENEAQFVQTDEMYKNMTKQRDVYIRDAQRRIDTIKQKLSQAEIAESQAKLAEIATTTSSTWPVPALHSSASRRNSTTAWLRRRAKPALLPTPSPVARGTSRRRKKPPWKPPPCTSSPA